MLRRPSFWLVVSLMCLVGAVYFWRQGETKRQAEQKPTPAVHETDAKAVSKAKLPPVVPAVTVKSNAATVANKSRYPYRLSNTDKTTGQLLRNTKAVHLMNALLDTSKPLDLSIPDKLRAPKNNGSYVVQARGAADNNFRALLQNAGATIVSYIPNNAYLVRVSEAGAQQLASQTQSVLPFEPYYKLEPSLLKAVMENTELPASTLKVTLFPDATSQIFTSLNIRPMATEPSPFGQVVTVPASASTIVDIARLPGVQAVAPASSRRFANDLTRVTLGVSADSLTTTTPYLGLSGSNVTININDSGVDATHPDLTNRIFGDTFGSLIDNDGHGTHVAGTILGSGSQSATVTNASGSVIPGASFRGMAPNANAYVISLDSASDSYLQEQAARTNSLISNNSWNYGDPAYDIASASYDAAVRDALPEVSGSQSLLFVFSAGNSGSGTDDGQNGTPDSILSPGTAKNVITVGAIEQFRNITNTVVEKDQTNQPFLSITDTGSQVANFSARGNVGINVEGDNGRFKPDVVAPGVFVISTRSSTWDTNAYYNPTNAEFFPHFGNSVDPGNTTNFLVPVPANPVVMIITVKSNILSPSPFPAMPIYIGINQIPSTNNPPLGFNQVVLPTNSLTINFGDTVFITVGDGTNNVTVNFDLQIEVLETNADLAVLGLLRDLNDSLAAPPEYYRYETGTSMATAAVSGTLACMEEFFTNTLKISNASPALMKALLINGARSLSSPGQPYDFQVATSRNIQGWGLPSLPNSIPPVLTNSAQASNTMPLLFFDQDLTNALATGQSKTRKLALSGDASSQPLRITLVWTDPPGNPTAGVKLVNDLDLIVTNLDTGDVYYGNDIPAGSIFNRISDTNALVPPADAVNNVENVFLPPSTGTNFSITVLGHHVNVNAVTLNTTDVVQDYALVISTGDAGGTAASPFTLTDADAPLVSLNNVSPVTTLTNGIPLLNQRVGANSQYASTTNGITNQWNFYVYTNTASLTNTAFTNVAFITFFPPNLGVPRMSASGEIDTTSTNATRYAGADLDMYVSTDPRLTNLDATVIAAAVAQGTVSAGRTGDETVIFTNSAPGQVYYIGIKSEDQEGGQYGFAGVASDIPFDQTDTNGNSIITLHPLPAPIPSGSASSPQFVMIFGVSTKENLIRKVTVTNTVTYPNFGDLLGTLNHNGVSVTLNNHTPFTNLLDATETFIYDDSGEGGLPGAQPSDGPGSLRSYVGTKGVGSWIFTMVNDSSPTRTGLINNLQLTVEPQPPTNGATRTLVGGGWFYDFIDVPVNCTNLTVSLLINGVDAAPLDLVIKRGGFPSLTDYDKLALINPPGGAISISSFDSPPLNPGRYFIGVFNPNATAVTFTLFENLGISLTPAAPFQFLSSGNESIFDDAVTYSTNHVGIDSRVVTAEVGVRLDHPRVSDLVLTLVSPEGTRVLLAENRGGSSTNYGSGVDTTNVFPQSSAGGPSASTLSIPISQPNGTVIITYNFFDIPDSMHIYYQGTKIFDSGLISGSGTFAVDFGPGTATNIVIIMNEGGNPNASTGWNYTAEIITKSVVYAIFTEDTNRTTLPIKFAVPPFGGTGGPSVPISIFTSSFEGIAAGDYNSVDGWTTADTNTVKVVTVPALAANGSNVLALHQGSITRVLAGSVAGATYTLNLSMHGRPHLLPVSWWKGENNANDEITASANNGTEENTVTYGPGLVGQAFQLNGNAHVRVPDSPSLEFSNMTAEAWIYPTNIVPGQDYGIMVKFDANLGNGGSAFSMGIAPSSQSYLLISTDGIFGSAQVNDTGPMLQNQWVYVASTFDGANLNFYLNGQLDATLPFAGSIFPGTDDLGIGGNVGGLFTGDVRSPFQGLIDEATVYSNALTLLQIQDIYAAGSAGKVGPFPDSLAVSATVSLGGLTTNISALDDWTNYSITFIAPSNNTVLEITPGADGVLLDGFSLLQSAVANPSNYYLPEESLAKVTGENAKGDWKLEVLDNRAGPPGTNVAADLVSWQLNLITETKTPTAIPLQHAIPQTNLVPPNSVVYYIVDVPPWALFATNTLFNVNNGPLALLFNQNFEPGTTTNGGDYTILPSVSSSNSTTLMTNLVPPPPLVPGQRYYLGVTNLSPTTASFSIEVDFDITTLTNMVPVTNTLPASSIPRYYQFDVSTNAIGVAFQLLNVTGNLSLVVSKGPPLPTLANNAYSSSYLGASTETITVLTNSLPVPLAPGRWYLGVFNNDVVSETYTIMASEFGPPTIIPLVDSVGFTTNFPPGPPINTFFSFTITNTNSAVLFELYDLSGNVDLTVDRGPGNYPYQPPYFRSSTRGSTNSEQIVIRTNIIGTNINDVWYLGVPNNDTTNVTFTIRATAATNGLLLSGIPIDVGIQNSTNGLTFTWPTVAGESYNIEETPTLVFSGTNNWTILATVTNAPPYLDTFLNSNSISGSPSMFYRIQQVPSP